ncbi:hypothetical protein C8Q76DRAFT_771203 [Earliella scabrosa]|nr:hypothetical protein C8Q76DRAFT_771203 [Earliella scabrosa]
MSRCPSPDAPSPAADSETSPTRGDSEPASRASDGARETSEAASDSQAKDASASRSASESPSSSAPAPEETSASSTPASGSTVAATSMGSWQAVWSAAHNAYYFYNSVTQETTWVNPLQPNAEAGPSNTGGPSGPSDATSTPGASSSQYDLYAAAAAQGIDPALAHLDPSLAAPGTAPGAFTYAAKFNARTGAFTRPDGRDPSHLSEYERAKRMSEFYFDVNAWEHEVEKRKLEEAQEEESRKRKKPTKKDLERFKEQKRQKKLAKTAWLRT